MLIVECRNAAIARLPQSVLKSGIKSTNLDAVFKAIQKLPKDSQYDAYLQLRDDVTNIADLVSDGAAQFIDHLTERQDELEISDETFQEVFGNLKELAKAHTRNRKQESRNTLSRKWNPVIADRLANDHLYSESTLSAIVTTSGRLKWDTAILRVNNVVCARLLRPGRKTSGDNTRRMTTKDWKFVTKNKQLNQAPLSYEKLVILNLHTDEFGILVEGAPDPQGRIEDGFQEGAEDSQIITGDSFIFKIKICFINRYITDSNPNPHPHSETSSKDSSPNPSASNDGAHDTEEYGERSDNGFDPNGNGRESFQKENANAEKSQEGFNGGVEPDDVDRELTQENNAGACDNGEHALHGGNDGSFQKNSAGESDRNSCDVLEISVLGMMEIRNPAEGMRINVRAYE